MMAPARDWSPWMTASTTTTTMAAQEKRTICVETRPTAASAPASAAMKGAIAATVVPAALRPSATVSGLADSRSATPFMARNARA